MSPASQLRLLQLVSPSLPIGSYAYSQGLEYAIDSGWLSTEYDVGQWIKGILHSSFCVTDLALLRKCFQAWEQNDLQQIVYWNDYVFACRETKEFSLEEQQLGYSLHKLLMEIEPTCLSGYAHIKNWSYIAMYARAVQSWQVDLKNAALGFTYTWVENQLAAAIKLVPLGQLAGQRLLSELQKDITESVEKSFTIPDEQIGLSLPGLSIASCLHETQYTRLFRS